MYVKNGHTGTAIAEAMAERIQKLRDALEEIDSQAVAAPLARNPSELLRMLEHIHEIAEKALET